MAEGAPRPGPPRSLFLHPQVRLWGVVDDAMLRRLHELIDADDSDGPLVIELSTNGGDADAGRRIAMDVRFLSERLGRRILFLGVSTVYSAGVTVMAAFPPEDRFLTSDAVLLIHCRRMDQQVELRGSLRVCRQKVEELRAQVEIGEALEREGFAELVRGTQMSLEEVLQRCDCNWYLTAQEALARGLVAGVVTARDD